jgi:phosphohistidine phosphatase SixA
MLACTRLNGDGAGLPAEVFLIRHAEEPPTGVHLDDRGRARAKGLVGLFSERFNRPTALFATQSSSHSARAVETLQPLADALHLSIDERFATLEYEPLASAILKGSYAGGHVLACWHRESIADLAGALGVKHPPQWPSGQYDRLWWIRFENDGVKFSDEPQRLLPGDSATPGSRQK